MKKINFSDKFGLTEAVLSGRKTQTRRIITCPKMFKGKDVRGFNVHIRQSDGAILEYPKMYDADEREFDDSYIMPKYQVGEVVAVAQSYKDAGYDFCMSQAPYINKMFTKAEYMPHQIRITNVRVERLQDISDEDCIKEGVIKGRVGSEDTHFMDAYYVPNMPLEPCVTPQRAYATLINRVSGKGTWESNPYVFVYDFELVK